MNSYLLTRLFYQQLESSEVMQLQCTPHHQALFFRIIQVQNQVGWQVKSIGLPTEHTMFFACIGSYKTYRKCLLDLMSWGLINDLSPSKNQYQARQISLHTDKWRAFFAEAGSMQLPTQDQSTAEASTKAGSMHCPSTDQSIANASPAYKTSKLLNEETIQPLNLETIKDDYSTESPKSTENEISHASEINFSAKEKLVSHSIDEIPPPQEKKKVAPKRNDNSTKPNVSSAELKENRMQPKDSAAKPKDASTPLSIPTAIPKSRDKPDLLFKDSLYADKSMFLSAFTGSEYEGANLEYYYEIVKNWSESKQAKKKDWIATVKNWMLRDFKEGKLVTHEPQSYRQSKATDAAGQNSYAALGNAVDQYFERKYGK